MALNNIFKTTVTVSTDFGKSLIKKLLLLSAFAGLAVALTVVGLTALVAAILK